MTPELAFLLASVRRFFRPEHPPPSTAGVDWSRVAQLAERHAVAALFHHVVQRSSDIPPRVLAVLRDQARNAARFDLTLNAELSRLLDLFERHQIPVVSLKGPVLGVTLYGDAALRSSTDLDLLIHRDHALLAKQLLEDRGYHLDSVLHWPAADACLSYRDSQISFSRQTDAARVDLHWRLLPGYFPRSFDDGEVWLKLRMVPLAGVTVPTLPPERLLLFLCAHGTKHLWDRLAWVCDVARLVQVESLIDWAEVFERARQTDTTRMLLLGLNLASELMGVELPSAVTEKTADPGIRALTSIILQRIYDELPRPSTMESARFSLHGFERFDHRLRFIFGIFVEPTEAEYISLKLPPFLHWLYYLYRPIRLAARNVRSWFRGSSEP